MNFKMLLIKILFLVLICVSNVFAKALPPGSGIGDVPANVLILLDKSGSMSARMTSGAGVYYPSTYATLMVGPLANPDPDCTPPFVPGSLCQGLSHPYSLAVSANAAIMGNCGRFPI